MSSDAKNPDVLNGLHRLERVAEAGESDRTPLILLGEVWFWVAVAALVVTAVTLMAVRLASL